MGSIVLSTAWTIAGLRRGNCGAAWCGWCGRCRVAWTMFRRGVLGVSGGDDTGARAVGRVGLLACLVGPGRSVGDRRRAAFGGRNCGIGVEWRHGRVFADRAADESGYQRPVAVPTAATWYAPTGGLERF